MFLIVHKLHGKKIAFQYTVGILLLNSVVLYQSLHSFQMQILLYYRITGKKSEVFGFLTKQNLSLIGQVLSLTHTSSGLFLN